MTETDKISWKAEFADPAAEAAFHARSAVRTARQLRTSLIVWGGLLFLFALLDTIMHRQVEHFWLLLASRAGSIAVILAGLVALSRRPDLAVGGALVTAIQLVNWTFLFLLFVLLPRSSIPYLVTMIAVCLIAVFVVFPNRLILAGVSAAYAVVGSVFALDVAVSLAADEAITILLILATPAFLGLFVAHRFQVMLRKEFSALAAASRANAEVMAANEELAAANRELERENEERRRLEAELERQARVDPLTNLHNRRGYEELFDAELRRTRRSAGVMSLCVLDLDHFKSINDNYGHEAGDAVLRTVADVCRRNLREVDIIGRLGGEEFVVILPDTGLREAEAVVERLRQALEQAETRVCGLPLRVTATFGLTELRPQDKTVHDLVRRADEALYEGKRAGRNRVEAA